MDVCAAMLYLRGRMHQNLNNIPLNGRERCGYQPIILCQRMFRRASYAVLTFIAGRSFLIATASAATPIQSATANAACTNCTSTRLLVRLYTQTISTR